MTEHVGFVAAAEETCRRRGLNLTPIRRRVLEILAASKEPISAYAILRCLSDTRLLGPPTVYRALEFLTRAGFVHHLRLRKAYVCQTRPSEAGFAALLTCTVCGSVSQSASPALDQSIMKIAAAAAFEPKARAIEIEGRCSCCREAAYKGVSRWDPTAGRRRLASRLANVEAFNPDNPSSGLRPRR